MESDPTSDLARSGVLVAGKFRLDQIIGSGGMGSVWSATHVTLGHRIAVKLISRELVRLPGALRRFDAEAKAAALLQSRHVVQVFDHGTLDDGTPYIVMELLSGESLQHRLDRVGRIGLREAVDILAQCCKALGRAHAMGIVHRDIKPDNIFLGRMPDEDLEVVKILDFGVAKVTLGESSSSAATGTGALLGTPLYMSPEQVRTPKTVDHRADLYSLGLSTYMMLTGQLAVSGESFADILLKICTQPLPALRRGAPWLPHAMEPWFERVCARNPADRCQSAQDFIDSLRAASTEDPSIARGLPRRAQAGDPIPPTVPQSFTSASPQPAQSPAVAPIGPTLKSGPANLPPPGGSAALPPTFFDSSTAAAGAAAGPIPQTLAQTPVSRSVPAPIAPAFVHSGSALALSAAQAPRKQVVGAIVGAFCLALLALAAVWTLFVLRQNRQLPSTGRRTDAVSTLGDGAKGAAPLPATSDSPTPAIAGPTSRGPAPIVAEKPQALPPLPTAPAAQKPPQAPPKGPAAATIAAPAPAPRNCNPNYYFDRDGDKHFKPECY
jgi:serine/threonine protein kinase